MTSSPVISLASEFPTPPRADWLALVSKTLKGAAVDSLVVRTADGLPIKPLYTADESIDVPIFAVPPRNAERGWDARARVDAVDPSMANAQALTALAGGAGSLLLVVRPENTEGGPGIASVEALAKALDGVMLDVAPVALDAGFAGLLAAQWLGSAAKSAPGAPLAFHLDPLSAFAAVGASPGPIQACVDAAADGAVRLVETYPKATLFLANGAVVHEAGGTSAWELGFALASAVAYAKALVAAGLPMADAFARIVLGLAVDAEPIGAIAKLRAARALWARITSACGVEGPARIEARTSSRMLTRADRWTNLVRLTSAGFGAAVGGADSVILGAFTDAIGPADAFALRQARNTQLVLMEEAHLGRVADPAGGSWALEAQTSALARAAWESFVAIEAAGGAIAALQTGVIADAAAAARDGLKAALANRSLRIVGVTDFKSEDATPDLAPQPPLGWTNLDAAGPGENSACPALAAIRLEDLAQ